MIVVSYEVRLRRLVGGRTVVALVESETGRLLASATVQGSDVGDLPLDIELTTEE